MMKPPVLRYHPPLVLPEGQAPSQGASRAVIAEPRRLKAKSKLTAGLRSLGLTLLLFFIFLAVVYSTAFKENLRLPNSPATADWPQYLVEKWPLATFVALTSLATFGGLYALLYSIFRPSVDAKQFDDFTVEYREALGAISVQVARIEESGGGRLALQATRRPTGPRAPILAHFLDHHVLRIRGLPGPNQTLKDALIEEAITALALCVLSGRTVLVPAVSYFEGPLSSAINKYFSVALATGAISLVGDAQNITEFLGLRLSEYPLKSPQFERYWMAIQAEAEATHPFVGLPINSTAQMHIGWQQRVEQIDRILFAHGNPSNPQFVENLPEALGARAFVAEYAYPIFEQQRIRLPETTLADTLNGIFFDHLSAAAGALMVYDLPMIGQPTAARTRGAFSFREARLVMRAERVELRDLIPMTEPQKHDMAIRKLGKAIAGIIDAGERS
jgi:hypothetical protein